MEELTLIGLIYVIVGGAIAFFMSFTLILLVVGLLLMILGKKYSRPIYGSYPMLQPCTSCGRNIDLNTINCPYCQRPLTSQLY